MSGQHTPGPWLGGLLRQHPELGDEILAEFVKHKGKEWAAITDGKDQFIAWIAVLPDTIEEDEANARLIAAAPDLLEALETGRDYVADALSGALKYDDGQRIPRTMMSEDLARIDAALDKARTAVNQSREM